MNLLERMAEALRHEHEGNKDALASLMERGIYDGVDDDAKRQMDEVDALLAEYERVKARTVMLTFEKADHELSVGESDYIVMDKTYGKPCMVFSVKPSEDYAYAVLPPMPGPEVFK